MTHLQRCEVQNFDALLMTLKEKLNIFSIKIDDCGKSSYTAKRVVPPTYTVCLLIWVAKLETSQVLQSNKNKTYRGR